MPDSEIETAGRLSALEYVLEVLLSNNLAFMPPLDSMRFKAKMLSSKSYIKRGPVSVDTLAQIDAATASSLANFMDKVDEREQEIRNKIAESE